MKHFVGRIAAGFSLSFVLSLPLGAQTCAALAGIPAVDSAESIAAGTFELAGGRGGPRTITDLPSFCRVQVTLAPDPDSAIRVEVWLPDPAAWNGRYLAVGNGAFAGSIGTNAMFAPLRLGYAVSSTDTGHEGGSGDFALIEARLIDFGYRAVHEMAVISKTLVESFYSVPLAHSYFQGCSTGGRQALMAVQKYPLDFDGVVSGAPAINGSHLHAAQTWSASLGPAAGGLPAEKFDVLGRAAVASCDLLDGVGDNVIENPLKCQPQDVVDRAMCSGGSTGGQCLSSEESALALQVYTGPTADGRSVFPGLAPGSESGWATLLGSEPLGVAEGFYRFFVHKDPDWDYATLDLVADVALAERVVGEAVDANDPDIAAFIDNGGKLLLYHGWADPGISPYNTINYYDAVTDANPNAEQAVRLFMMPGVGHCAGGEGPSSFDALGAIDDWVSGGPPPDTIIASRVRSGEVDRTRPLCAYPAVAVYDGSGSTDDASNFTCE